MEQIQDGDISRKVYFLLGNIPFELEVGESYIEKMIHLLCNSKKYLFFSQDV